MLTDKINSMIEIIPTYPYISDNDIQKACESAISHNSACICVHISNAQ
jgi:deoxyribose-phosphate aldolase